jgi:hypothetical protein
MICYIASLTYLVAGIMIFFRILWTKKLPTITEAPWFIMVPLAMMCALLWPWLLVLFLWTMKNDDKVEGI